MLIALNLDTQSINFTIVHAQANLKNPVCIEIPWGFEPNDANYSLDPHYMKIRIN